MRTDAVEDHGHRGRQEPPETAAPETPAVDATRSLPLGQQQRRDQISGQREERGWSEERARCVDPRWIPSSGEGEVEHHHAQHQQCAQPVEGRNVAELRRPPDRGGLNHGAMLVRALASRRWTTRRCTKAIRRGPWRLALWWLASMAVAVLHNGLWATPNLAFVSLIARRPGENPFAAGLEGDYLLTDQSLTNLAHRRVSTAPHEIARLHLVVLVVAWAAVVVLARHRFGHRPARALTVLIAASPVVTVSMQWLGQPDPLTAMCGIAMVLVRRRSAVVALAVLGDSPTPNRRCSWPRWRAPFEPFSPTDRRTHRHTHSANRYTHRRSAPAGGRGCWRSCSRSVVWVWAVCSHKAGSGSTTS